MRILISQELTATGLRQLFENSIDILRVPGFYPEEASIEIARRFDRSNLRGPYDGAPNIDRIGRALFEKQISSTAAAEYEAHSLDWIDQLRGAVRPLQLPIDLLRLKLDELHRSGSTLATIEGTRAFCGLIRIFPAGGEAEPHMDVLAWDLPDGHPDGRLLGQFAANVYCRVPQRGGELKVWPISHSKEEYRRHQRPESYGLLPTGLVGEPVMIRPGLGELIMFNSRLVHAVGASPDEDRIAASCFVGTRGDTYPLSVWS